MVLRKQNLLLFPVALTAAFSVLMLSGCASTGLAGKRNNFQLQFAPTPPPAASVTEPAILEPPTVATNAFLSHETPKFLIEPPATPAKPTASDVALTRAERAFQQGRRLYHAGKKEEARREFDRTLDFLFDASDQPTNRHRFERSFDEIVDSIHRIDLAGLNSGVSQDEPQFDKSPLEDILEMTFPVDPKLKMKVREGIQATSSQLPLVVNDAVLGFIQYFSGRGRRTLVAGLERAGRYRPMIQRILEEEGVPQELIHLAQAESGFLPRAISRMKATGMWQFVAFRGQEYGLMRTAHYDDRLDPEKATRAAARHLRDLFDRYGDWFLAIAAYNCGPGNVNKAIERTGYADFWELRNRRTLPMETTNYVPIILAMTIMAKNPVEYGLEGVVPDAPLEYDEIETASPTHLALVSDLTDTPLSTIQSMNPALLKSVAPAGYAVRVPRATGQLVHSMLQTIPAERRASWRMHRVGEGETVPAIAKRYGTAVSAILAANNLDSASPSLGDRLLIPRLYSEPAVVKVGLKTGVRKATVRKVTARQTVSSRRPSTRRAATVKQSPVMIARAGR